MPWKVTCLLPPGKIDSRSQMGAVGIFVEVVILILLMRYCVLACSNIGKTWSIFKWIQYYT